MTGPPASIRLEDRSAYLDALERTQTSGDGEPYRQFMLQRVDATLADYLQALGAASSSPP